MYVCVCMYVYDAWMRLKGVYECLGLVWWSKCSILEKLFKAKFHTLDTFEKSKFQNRPISSLKIIGLSHFFEIFGFVRNKLLVTVFYLQIKKNLWQSPQIALYLWYFTVVKTLHHNLHQMLLCTAPSSGMYLKLGQGKMTPPPPLCYADRQRQECRRMKNNC